MSLYAIKHHNCPTCRCDEPVHNVSASDSNELLCVSDIANLENLQRVFKKMHRLLELRKEDSTLIDLVNHAETLVENIKGKVKFSMSTSDINKLALELNEHT